MTLVAGTTIGPYRIIEQIGRGGMATVYKAYQASLARNVAIKVLPAFFAEDPGFRERFQQEAIAVAKLRHPSILQVFDYGEENGVTYIVSEFVDGGTLADQLGTPLPADYAGRILTPIAAALDYAHARGILHRDIKPSNVLLARDGTPILSDFGLAKMVGSMPRLTQTGTAVGTPEYMAPEQGMGETIGPAADQYALGVVAYEMLTGQVPFSAETPLAVLLAHVHKPLPLPRSVNPALSEGLELVLLKALAKVPGDRYPRVSEFVNAIAEAARGVMPAIAPTAPPPAAVVVAPTPSATATGGPATSARTAPGMVVTIPHVGRRAVIAVAAAIVVVAGLLGFSQLSAREELRRDVADAPATPAPAGRTQSSPATTAAATAAAVTAAPRASIPVKGKLIAAPKLDAAETAFESTDAHPDESFAEVRARDGELELAVLKSGGAANATFIDAHPQTYVAELDLRFTSGSRVDLIWQLYASQDTTGFPSVRISATSETVSLAFVEFTGSTGRERRLIGNVAVQGLRSGRPVTIGVAVTGDRYLLYVDGRQVGDAAEKRTDAGSPSIYATGSPGTGAVIVTGMRLYEYSGG